MFDLYRYVKNFRKNTSGYTTIELLIAMQLAFLVISLAYTSYEFSQQFFKKWEQKSQLESHLAVCSKTLSTSLWQINQIISADQKSLLAIKTTGDTLRIQFAEEIYINYHLLTLTPFILRDSRIDYLLETPQDRGFILSWSNFDPDHFSNLKAIHLTIVLNFQEREYTLRIVSRLLHCEPVI